MPAEKFDDIYRDLKSKVEDETYPAGTMLPSEAQLTKIYRCSRNTVRRALAMLAERGYTQSIHGKGVQVIYEPVTRATFTVGNIESFAESARRNGIPVKTAILKFTTITIDEKAAARTGFPVGSECFYIQRLRRLDGTPVILDINVFLKSEMPALSEEIAEGSIYKYLEEDLKMQITTSNRQITAEKATPADSRYLELHDLDFVAVVTGRTYNSKGIQFESVETPPGLFRLLRHGEEKAGLRQWNRIADSKTGGQAYALPFFLCSLLFLSGPSLQKPFPAASWSRRRDLALQNKNRALRSPEVLCKAFCMDLSVITGPRSGTRYRTGSR